MPPKRPVIRKGPPSRTYKVAQPTTASDEYPYPGRRSNGDPWIDALREASVEFWRSRNVNADDARVVIADDLLYPGAVGLGRKDAREIVLDGKVVGRYLANARNENYSVRGRRRNLNRLGELIAHEIGHVGGLEHSEEGLMAGHTQLGPLNPAEVQSVVRKLIRRNAVPNAHERSLADRDRRRRRAATRDGARRVEG